MLPIQIAQAAFANPEAFSRITYMPVDIVRDYSHLLLASVLVSAELDPDEYQLRANDWLHRFHSSECQWNWPSVTVHVIAEHGIHVH